MPDANTDIADKYSLESIVRSIADDLIALRAGQISIQDANARMLQLTAMCHGYSKPCAPQMPMNWSFNPNRKASKMDDLRESVALTLGPLLERAHNEYQLADAAIAAVMEAMREPTKAMLAAGIDAAEEVVDYTTDTNDTWRIDSPSDMPMPVWQAMLAQFQKDNSHDQ